MKGCQSQGDTLEEAIANINEAIELYLEAPAETSTDQLSLAMDRMAAEPQPETMSPEEVAEEIAAMRAERRS